MSQYDNIEIDQDGLEQQYLQTVTISEQSEEQGKISSDNEYTPKRKKNKLSSKIWTTFSIVSREDHIAACKICGAQLSFKTTISNLKKHIERKHTLRARGLPYQKILRKSTPISVSKSTPIRTSKPTKLTELGGLDGLILNVIADEGEDPTEVIAEEVEQSDDRTDQHDYCIADTGNSSSRRKHRSDDISERNKRNRIIDLQMECLELKKYNMQMESLLLEQQLNLPRSMYTENLRGGACVTRGTQTDVGGGNTKVFYITDKQSNERSQHLFTFQD